MKGLLTFLVLALSLAAGEADALIETVAQPAIPGLVQTDRSSGRRLWRYSMLTLAAVNVMDVQSSWGKHELNSALASPNGTFGARGTLIKSGLQGGVLAMQFLLTRHHPNFRVYRFFSVLNLATAGTVGATAIHNYSVPRPGR